MKKMKKITLKYSEEINQIKSQSENKSTQFPPDSTRNQQFKHDNLYNFCLSQRDFGFPSLSS